MGLPCDKAVASLALFGLFIALRAAAAPAATEAGHGASGSHGGPVVPVLLGLVVILAAAKLGGELFERIGQPAVLGELLFGMVLGNLSLAGLRRPRVPGTDRAGLEILAQLGVILLLFQVGLESNVQEMLSVGWSSLLVAVLGVIAPFFLGWGVSAWLLPEEETLAHVFIGATLCATSVGITARVLDDLGKLSTRESKIVLGAAVIDDVLGLVILSVVAGTITAANTGGSLDAAGRAGDRRQGARLPGRRASSSAAGSPAASSGWPASLQRPGHAARRCRSPSASCSPTWPTASASPPSWAPSPPA